MNTDALQNMVEVTLNEPDDFLLVKESLTRIGVPSKVGKVLTQSCHILHKRGRYYVCMFKELFLLDGKKAEIKEEDIQRRNLIAKLLSDWGLVTVVDPDTIANQAPLAAVKILSFAEKREYQLIAKYTLGTRK